MIKSSKLFLIRHSPVKQVKGYFPRHDPNAIVRDSQIKKLAKIIPGNSVWYVSPLRRAIQTAKALSKYTKYSKMIIENQLVEQNFGDWSGKKVSQIWQILKHNQNKHNFSFISPELSPPNGESFKEQSKRVVTWLENLDLLEGNNIVIISHAGTIRSIISHALQIKLDYALGIEINYETLSILEIISNKDNKYNGGRFRLISLNK